MDKSANATVMATIRSRRKVEQVGTDVSASVPMLNFAIGNRFGLQSVRGRETKAARRKHLRSRAAA
jgi:hypothetical protein